MLESSHRIKRVYGWFADAARLLLAVIVVAGVILLVLILLGKVHLYGGDVGDNFANRLYLLSAIAQSLAAILSLVVSLTLIATQLAAQTYSPRVVNLRLRDPWLWGAVGLYLVAIVWAMKSHGKLMLQWQESADIALLLAGAALLYLVPFTIATLHSLDPRRIAARLAKESAITWDDMMRRAVNESLLSVLADGLNALKSKTIEDLKRNSAVPDARRELIEGVGTRLWSIGKHARQVKNADALDFVQYTFGSLIKYCDRQKWIDEKKELEKTAREVCG